MESKGPIRFLAAIIYQELAPLDHLLQARLIQVNNVDAKPGPVVLDCDGTTTIKAGAPELALSATQCKATIFTGTNH